MYSCPGAPGTKQHKLLFLFKQQQLTLSPARDQKSETKGSAGPCCLQRLEGSVPLASSYCLAAAPATLGTPGLVDKPLLSLPWSLRDLLPLMSLSVSSCPVGTPVIEFRGHSKLLPSHLHH